MRQRSPLDCLVGGSDQAPTERAQPAPAPIHKSSTWMVPNAARLTWQHFRADSRAVGPISWQQWWRTLVVGFILTMLLTLGLTDLGQSLQKPWLQAWDVQALRWIVRHGPLTFANAITWQAPGDLLFQPIFVLTCVALAIWWSRPLIAASMAAAYILSFAFIWTGWGLWSRSRPDLIAGGVAAPGFHSFPSGHAILTVVIYGLLAYLWVRASRRWLERVLPIGVYFVWITLVCTSRLALGSHWPSDVLGGAVIGLAWLTASIIALQRAERVAQDLESGLD